MDLDGRFWDSSENLVLTRYWNSEFFGKASAKDLYKKFNQDLSLLKKERIIQISSDGPNVNLAFLDIVTKNRTDEELSQLIHIGTCGLHTLHGSLKCGENTSGWNVKKLLSSIFKIF